MSQALYRKWRPQSWESVVGQQHIVQTLQNSLAAGRIAHAYLFAGPRGTGKTTTARLLAKAVNCLAENNADRPCGQCEHCLAVNQGRFLDLIEIDAASNTSVEDVRDLRDKINFTPNQGRYKVYIIDEVHMLSTAAFNALLKTLEEPPSHAIFVLATTEVHKIPATVLSRCQRHEFRRIPVADIVAHLQQMAQDEGIQVEHDALTLIARQSTGAMRDAISLLDQLSSTGQKIDLALVQQVLGAAASQSVLDLVEAWVAKDSASGLDCIHTALDGGSDPRQLARQVVDYLRDLLLMRMGNAAQIEATPELRIQMARHAQAFTPAELLRVIRAFNSAAVEGRGAWMPSLPLEMAFIEALAGPVEVLPVKSPPLDSHAGTPLPEAPVQKEPSRQASAEPSRGPVKQPPKQTSSAPTEESTLSPEDQQANKDLAARWDKGLALIRQENRSLYALISSCKSRFMRGDQVLLGFASNVLIEKMEKADALELAQRIFSQVFERPILIRCHVDTHQRGAIPSGVDQDGMVASAIRELGGELVDMN